MPDKDPCGLITGIAKKMCENNWEPEGGGSSYTGGGGITGGASEHVKDLAEALIKTLRGLLAPKRGWAPEETDNPVYAQFLWLGQHLAIAILICVIVVCALTAWQGAPRLKQLGASTGWTLAAVAGDGVRPGGGNAVEPGRGQRVHDRVRQ